MSGPLGLPIPAVLSRSRAVKSFVVEGRYIRATTYRAFRAHSSEAAGGALVLDVDGLRPPESFSFSSFLVEKNLNVSALGVRYRPL